MTQAADTDPLGSCRLHDGFLVDVEGDATSRGWSGVPTWHDWPSELVAVAR